MSEIDKIRYKGREIIYVDYRDKSEADMLKTAEALRSWLLTNESPHLRLVNITGAYATPRFTNFIRELGRETGHIPAKSAIVGITGAKKVLLKGYNRIVSNSMRPFDSEEEAKEYLVAE